MSGTNSEEQPIDVSASDNSNSTVEISEKVNIENVEEEVVNALRAQLEYYFSFENLCKDTFLCSIMSSSRTEMEQRSGTEHGRHAPIVMLARFGKVKKIVNNIHSGIVIEATVQQYLEQAALSSDKLEVVAINGSQLLGIGPKSGSPLPYESDFQKEADVSPQLPPAPKHTERNTIILREMPATATQQQVEEIFSWEGCPQVKSVHADVGYCWFVTFQATEDEVVSVLLKLRNMKYEEQSIKARLKPQSTVKPVYSAPAQPSDTDATQFPTANSDIAFNNTVDTPNKNSQNKANNRSKSTNNRNGVNGRNNGRYSATDRNNRNRPYTRPRSPATKANKQTPMPPPEFHDSHFPSLMAENESPADKPALSSPDTTEEPKENNSGITGYAAALLKSSYSRTSKTPSPPPTTQKKPSPTVTTPKDTKQHTIKTTDRISKGKNIYKPTPTKLEDDGSNRTATTDEKSSISSQSDHLDSNTPSSVSWSGKKSFADVLKKQGEVGV